MEIGRAQGEGDEKTGAETRVLWVQVKDSVQPSEAGRGQGHIRLESLQRK